MKKVQVATHSGIFHADEVFALAVLKMVFEKSNKEIEIIRTRDLDKIASADIVVDVGGEHKASKKRFDHHQKGRAGERKNGIPYAAFGLVWKAFGKKITSNKDVWEAIDKKLVTPIDAIDNGISLSTPITKGVGEYNCSQIISAISRSFEENETDLAFSKAIEFASLVLKGEIKNVEAKIEGERLTTHEILKQNEPEVLVLEKYLKWHDAVEKFTNIKFVIFPDSFSTKWCIQAAHDDKEGFDGDRISFPAEWRGLMDSDLDLATGLTGSVFCHAGGFFAHMHSREGAIEMANKAIFLSLSDKQ